MLYMIDSIVLEFTNAASRAVVSKQPDEEPQCTSPNLAAGEIKSTQPMTTKRRLQAGRMHA